MASINTPLAEKHRILLGKNATTKQTHFYENFPQYRGISDSTLDPEILEAIVISALTFGKPKDRVYILAPSVYTPKILDHFDKTVTAILEKCKRYPEPLAKRATKGYIILFKKIAIIERRMQNLKEPEYWLSFGFTKNNPIPDWIKSHLRDLS